MQTTRISFIRRLQASQDTGWSEFQRSYQPMIGRWLLMQGISAEDAEDISQEVMLRMSEMIEKFDHNGSPGAFRSWMHKITINVMRNFRRTRSTQPIGEHSEQFEELLKGLEDDTTSLSRQFHREHNAYLVWKLLEGLDGQFTEQNLELSQRYCILNEDPEKIAAEMNVDRNQVYVAKFRIMRALRNSVTDVDARLETGDVGISE